MKFRILAFLTLVAMCSVPIYADGLTGETINVDRLNSIDGFDFNTFAGLNGAYTVGVSSPYSLSLGDNLFASANATDLILDYGPHGGAGGGLVAADTKVVFSQLYLGTGISITGFSVVTDTVPGITSADIVFDSNSVTILQGLARYSGGQKLDVALTTTATPEPSSVILLTIGMAGLILMLVMRKRTSIGR